MFWENSKILTWMKVLYGRGSRKKNCKFFDFIENYYSYNGWSAMSRDIRSNFCIRIVSRNIFFQNFPRFQEILNPFCPFNLSNRSIKKLLNINCAPRDCKYKYISLKENYLLQIISLEKKK